MVKDVYDAEPCIHLLYVVHILWLDGLKNCGGNKEKESRDFYEVKPTLKKWARMFKMSIREEVVINRLRLGHTLITHGYLFDYEDGFIRQPPCRWCEAELLSIKHVLLDCPVLQNVREDILKTALFDRNITMETLIGESGAIRSVLTYLREIEIFDEI